MISAIVDEQIAGTRITVHDVYYYHVNGRSSEEIADILGLSRAQVATVMQYIQAHRPEIEAVHQRIEERNARGNPPEVEVKRQATQERIQAWLAERRAAGSQERNGEGLALSTSIGGRGGCGCLDWLDKSKPANYLLSARSTICDHHLPT